MITRSNSYVHVYLQITRQDASSVRYQIYTGNRQRDVIALNTTGWAMGVVCMSENRLSKQAF